MDMNDFVNAKQNLLTSLFTGPLAESAGLFAGIGIGPDWITGNLANLRLYIYVTGALPGFLGKLIAGILPVAMPVTPITTGRFQPLVAPGITASPPHLDPGDQRTLGPGAKIWAGVAFSNVGTFGAVVQDRNHTPGRHLLTCTHVLAGGAQVQFAPPHPAQSSVIADFVRDIPLGPGLVPADAGIALLRQGVVVGTHFPLELGAVSNVPGDLTAVASPPGQPISMNVAHAGAMTTGRSRVRAFRANIFVEIEGGVRHFLNCALMDGSFATQGDSGSIVVDTDTQKPMGIVFARGDREGDQGLVAACPLKAALDQLQVDLV